MYIAHINERTGETQSVREHSENVAALCEQFSIPELKRLSYMIGLAHDIGKYCNYFQRKINGENIRVDHSTAGAVAAERYYGPAVSMIAGLCIAGHHAGIPDAGLPGDAYREDHAPILRTRMAQKEKRCERDADENFEAYRKEIDLPKIDEMEIGKFLMRECITQKNRDDAAIDNFAFIVRYCFSCLVDADSIDTGTFCETRTEDTLQADFQKCLDKVNRRLDAFVCETELQRARSRLQKQAFTKAGQDAEIYLMHMPTGSGKTLCSVKFALQRAIAKKKKRIIYVIPYNNIIDQTAAEFEKIFGEDAQILRHQSSFSYEDMEDLDEDYRNALKNGTENWDAPLIITTAVQFFESLHSNKRGKLRKLHNLADSILVFDEARLMPMAYLQPCLQAVSYVTRYLNSEALFLTATMPDFETLLQQYTITGEKILHLIDDTKDFALFEKCSFEQLGAISAEALLRKAADAASALIVTNSKRAARKLYELADGDKYYLSTYLTAFDRKEIIKKIREKLKALENDFPGLVNVPEGRKIRIFSTSLIEAGVDLDLETVFRERTGLDSILQSGGRCNREGKREDAVTYTFSFADEELRSRETEASELAQGMFAKYDQITDSGCIREYYDRLFGMNLEKITGNTMSSYCKKNGLNIESLPFRSYAEKFHLIDDKTESIIVPQDAESRRLIESIRYQEHVSSRKLQKYACTVSKKEFEELMRQGVLNDYDRGIWCLTNENYYNQETGIRIELTDYIL